MSKRDNSHLSKPTDEQLRSIAERWGFKLSEDELNDYRILVNGALDEIATLDEYDELTFDLVSDIQSRSGYRPENDEDPHNAWITKCHVTTDNKGPLNDVEIGLKDCIAMAGIEMTCGSTMLKGFIPEVDATVVRRLLAEGARVVGKTNMDVFLFGATSRFQDFGGVTTNPHDPAHLAGGSTSGAAAIPSGECDVVIGTDQNGSSRAPSSWCGCVGIKPTFGLVPYTGIFSSVPSLDHVGVISDTIKKNARVLESIAGIDRRSGVRFDPRQPSSIEAGYYTDSLRTDPDNITIGVLEEGFDRSASEPEVDATVRDSLEALKAHGVETKNVSVTAHGTSIPQMNAIMSLATRSGIDADGTAPGLGGWKWAKLADTFNEARKSRATQFSPVVKMLLLIAGHLSTESGYHYYATAKNLMLRAEQKYTDHLKSVDALALPTTPMTAHEISEDGNLVERIQQDAEVMVNTSPFNHSGHPALTVPCGSVDGLPVGLQLVGSKFDEPTLYQIGGLIEEITDLQNT